jgi:hypothetical protein
MTIELRQMGTQRVQMKGDLPWACRAGTRDFLPAFAALVGPVQTFFSFTIHYFNSFIPIAQQAGHAVVLGRLSLSICLGVGTQIRRQQKKVDLLHYYVPFM